MGELRAGATFTSSTIIIDRERMLAFAREFDPQPFHLEEGFLSLGSVAASGWFTAAITQRLLLRDGLPLPAGMVGLSVEVRWPNAAKAGDVVHVESCVKEMRLSRSQPNRAIVTIYSETLSDLYVVLQQQTAIIMVPHALTSDA